MSSPEAMRPVSVAQIEFKVSDIDSSAPAYYGFIKHDGSWYIMRESSGAYRYCKGESDYTTNWTGRAALAYDYYNNIF